MLTQPSRGKSLGGLFICALGVGMRKETELNEMSPATKQAKLGERVALMSELGKLIDGGTGLVRAVVLSNTTTALAFTAFNFYVNGVPARKAAGTFALTATTHDVPIDKWASFRVSIAIGGTMTVTKQVAAEDDTEAAAVANLAATPANEVNMGYFVVRGGTAAIFDATTTNLATAAVAGMVVRYRPATPALRKAMTSLG